MITDSTRSDLFDIRAGELAAIAAASDGDVVKASAVASENVRGSEDG